MRATAQVNFATFDLNLMRVLDAILTEGSTVKAGEKLGMSQSAVSGALARLRDSLGDDLFVRQGNKLVPTNYASALALPLRDELDRIEAMFAPPGVFEPSVAEGTFRITASDFFAEVLMPPLAARIQKKAPGIRVQLVDLVPTDHLHSLERYGADLALIPDTEMPDWIEGQPAFYSSFSIIVRKGHPIVSTSGLRSGATMPIDLFCNIGHILFSPEGKLSAMGDDALVNVGRKRHVVMTLPVFSGVARAVSESDLIALVPRQLAERMAEGLRLDILVPPMPIEPALIIGAWHRKASQNPFHIWVRNEVFDLLRPLNDGEAQLPG